MLCHAGTKASVARPQRIHFNATFEEEPEGQGAQPEELSQQQAQMLTASSRLEALPRVSEEGEEAPETPFTISSGKADMAHDDARSGVSKEIPPLPHEAAQSVNVDFDNFTAPWAVTEIESTPAKVLVEFEEYHLPAATVPHGGNVSILCIFQVIQDFAVLVSDLFRFTDQTLCANLTFCALQIPFHTPQLLDVATLPGKKETKGMCLLAAHGKACQRGAFFSMEFNRQRAYAQSHLLPVAPDRQKAGTVSDCCGGLAAAEV